MKCATGGCHDDITRADGISFTSWDNTTADPNVVFKYHPESSSIMYAIKGQSPYKIMPPINSGIKPMTENQANGISTWIAEGAQPN